MKTKSRRSLARSVLFTALLLPSTFASAPAVACGDYSWMGTLCLFAGNWPIRGWARAEGQLMPIAGNEALYSIIGTAYGGDGTKTFALPDLRGRVPVGVSNSIPVGHKGGADSVTLTSAQLPSHSHQAIAKVTATEAEGNAPSPKGALWASESRDDSYYAGAPAGTVTMADDAVTVSISPAGGSQPVSVMQPYVGMTWLIKLSGAYPPR